MRNPLQKLLIGGASVLALSALAVAPASAGISSTQGDTGQWYANYGDCQYQVNQIRDGGTGAECLPQGGGWELYVYG